MSAAVDQSLVEEVIEKNLPKVRYQLRPTHPHLPNAILLVDRALQDMVARIEKLELEEGTPAKPSFVYYEVPGGGKFGYDFGRRRYVRVGVALQ